MVKTTELKTLLLQLMDSSKNVSLRNLPNNLNSESFYILHYKNSNSRITVRLIRIHYSQAYHKHVYIKAYCYLRNENRTFRLDRVISLYNADSIIKMGYLPKEIQYEINLLRNPKNTETNSPDKIYPQTSLDQTTHHKKSSSKKSSKRPYALITLSIFLGLLASGKLKEITDMVFFPVHTETVKLIPQRRNHHPPQSRKKITRIAHKATRQVKSKTITPLLLINQNYNPHIDKQLIAEINAILETIDTKGFSIPVDLTFTHPTTPNVKPNLIRRLSYRGVTIQIWETRYGRRYYAPSLYMDGATLREIKRKINDKLFEQITGIYNPSLNRMYARADINGDWQLSWREIKIFQEKLYNKYKYIPNRTALSPDKFIERGGGDCEDWALMTAGLLRYWGYSPYIGGLRNSRKSIGHAVCLMYSPTKPKDKAYIRIKEGNSLRAFNPDVKPGYYIPIDYTYVGSYSPAITNLKGKWYYTAIYTPERIYGWTM